MIPSGFGQLITHGLEVLRANFCSISFSTSPPYILAIPSAIIQRLLWTGFPFPASVLTLLLFFVFPAAGLDTWVQISRATGGVWALMSPILEITTLALSSSRRLPGEPGSAQTISAIASFSPPHPPKPLMKFCPGAPGLHGAELQAESFAHGLPHQSIHISASLEPWVSSVWNTQLLEKALPDLSPATENNRECSLLIQPPEPREPKEIHKENASQHPDSTAWRHLRKRKGLWVSLFWALPCSGGPGSHRRPLWRLCTSLEIHHTFAGPADSGHPLWCH